jgi:hypothetical protein
VFVPYAAAVQTEVEVPGLVKIDSVSPGSVKFPGAIRSSNSSISSLSSSTLYLLAQGLSNEHFNPSVKLMAHKAHPAQVALLLTNNVILSVNACLSTT